MAEYTEATLRKSARDAAKQVLCEMVDCRREGKMFSWSVSISDTDPCGHHVQLRVATVCPFNPSEHPIQSASVAL